MNAIAIDTHAFVKHLTKAGLTESQAESIIDLQRKTGEATLDAVKREFRGDELATCHDIKNLELKVELVRAELKKDIKIMKVKMSDTKAAPIRWVVGVGILQISIITALLLRLANHL